jgi:hypothetical protein
VTAGQVQADSIEPLADPAPDLVGIVVVDDSPAHLQLEVVQVVGRERGVMLEVWPAQVP